MARTAGLLEVTVITSSIIVRLLAAFRAVVVLIVTADAFSDLCKQTNTRQAFGTFQLLRGLIFTLVML